MDFAHYLSLGVNCEAGFQFRRILGEDRPGFFNWNITPIYALNDILSQDFFRIAELDQLVYDGNGNLVRDMRYGYHFHWIGDNLNSLDDGGDVYLTNHSRLNYLATKFRRTLASGSPIAFFYTLNGESNVNELLYTKDLIKNKYKCDKFVIVALTDESTELKCAQIADEIHIRTIKRFAPWNDATDGHVSSWDSVFREFPISRMLRFSGY